MSGALRIGLVGALFALASCEKAANIESSQAEREVLLPEADESGSYFLWTPEEQLVGYRNIEKIFDTRMVRAGGTSHPLPKADCALSISYEVDGERWTEETYMERNNVVGLLVIQDGEIALERYRHEYGPGQRWISFSVAKSITSTLVGAALADGAIRGLEDPLTQYLPRLTGSAYDGVTVRQLLTMTSGAAWNEDYADPSSDVAKIKMEPSVDRSDPIVAYMARLERDAEPGTKFHYNTGETHLVGSLVRAATGKTLANYLSEKIWTPYGMAHDATWMLDTSGREQAGCCLSASLRDFGRFGMFFLNGAEIDGKPIVPEGWVAMATTPTEAAQDSEEVAAYPQSGYGLMWWTTDGPAYQALGIFGQTIHINPELDLVIVTQSAWPTALSGVELQPPFMKAVEAAVQD